MINPKDFEMLESEETRKDLDPEFVSEFGGGLEEGEEVPNNAGPESK